MPSKTEGYAHGIRYANMIKAAIIVEPLYGIYERLGRASSPFPAVHLYGRVKLSAQNW